MNRTAGPPSSLTHARGRHEDPGDDHLRDGLFCSIGRFSQAGAVFIRDRNTDFEFPEGQNTRRGVHRSCRQHPGGGLC